MTVQPPLLSPFVAAPPLPPSALQTLELTERVKKILIDEAIEISLNYDFLRHAIGVYREKESLMNHAIKWYQSASETYVPSLLKLRALAAQRPNFFSSEEHQSIAKTSPPRTEDIAAIYQEALRQRKEGNRDGAKALFEQGARQGHVLSELNLAELVEPSHQFALWLSAILKEMMYPQTLFALGGSYFEGRGIERDVQKALPLLELAAEQGVAEAQNLAGYCYFAGEGTPPEYTRATYLYGQAAKQGHPQAQYNLALSYFHGTGIAKDESKALEWLKLAEQRGAIIEQPELSILRASKKPSSLQDEERTFELLTDAASQGFAPAQRELARWYATGRHVAIDEQKAAQLLAQVTHKSLQEMQYHVACDYWDGKGLPKDEQRALRLMTQLANQGFGPAQIRLPLWQMEKQSRQREEQSRQAHEQFMESSLKWQAEMKALLNKPL